MKHDQDIPQRQWSIIPDTAIQSPSNVPSIGPNLQSSQFVSQKIPQNGSKVVLQSSGQTLSGEKEFMEGHGTSPTVTLHSSPSQQKCSGRKELPQHLFAATYSSALVQSLGLQPVQAHGTGYTLQYSSAVQAPTMYQPTNGTHLFQSPMLSSTASSQSNALAPTSALQSCSLGYPCTQSTPLPAQSSPYGAMPFQPLSSLTSGMTSSSYMGQQLPNKMPPTGYQGVEVWGNNLAFLSTLNTTQQPGGRFYTLQRSSSSVEGNPFT